MEEFLRKIKLIDDLSTRINISNSQFVSRLRDNVEEANINSIFSGAFEVFSSNEKKYKGLVSSKEFHIRKKRRLFQKNRGTINATGTFKTNGDTLVINTKISAFSLKKVIISATVFFCYIFFISYSFDDLNSFETIFNNVPVFFFFSFLGILMLIWFSLKKEVAEMKKDLDKLFNSIASKVNN